MAHRSTYFTDREEEQLQELADEQGDSFSGVVRDAVQEVYGLKGQQE